MKNTENPSEILSKEAGSAILANRFLVEIGENKVEHAAAGGPAHGVSRYEAEAGEAASYQANGDVIVEAGEPIADNAEVEVGDDGVAMTHDAGTAVGRVTNGHGAAAAGDHISMRFYPVGQ